jgi:hypothetical protein
LRKYGEDGKTAAKALLICKWGGNITRAGVLQVQDYATTFWNEMLRPPPLDKFAVADNSDANTANGDAVPTDAEIEARFTDAAYLNERQAFLQNTQVYAVGGVN